VAEPEITPFGRYGLLERLASGGMGELFVALNPDDELCVVKRMLAQHLDKPDYVKMFLAEARLLQRLRHPHIVDVWEVGEVDGQPFFAMEYVRGQSLRVLLDELHRTGGELAVQHVADIGLQLLRALDHAHRAADMDGRELGVVHRDINPHNVIISWDGRVKLIDFGIAKSDVSGFDTAVGTIKGKFAYMSPEQSAAEAVDARSDLFSAAIVLYEALTLDNPFARSNVVLALEAIQLHAVPPPSVARTEAQVFDDMLLRALEKNPDLRFPHAMAFADAIAARGPLLPHAAEPLPALMIRLFPEEQRQDAARWAQWGDGDDREDWPTDPLQRRAERSRTPGAAPPASEAASFAAAATPVVVASGGSPTPAFGAAPPSAPGLRPRLLSGPAPAARPADGSAPNNPGARDAATVVHRLEPGTGTGGPRSAPNRVVRSGARLRRGGVYAAVLVLTTVASFGLTRALMGPAAAPPAAPVRGELAIDAEPPVWVSLGGPAWIRTPTQVRLHGTRGALQIAPPSDGEVARIPFRVVAGALRFGAAEGAEVEPARATEDSATAPTYHFWVDIESDARVRLSWRPRSDASTGR